VFIIVLKIYLNLQEHLKKKLNSFGTCLCKFTKTGKLRLNITALDYLAKYAQYKIWIKLSGEQMYLYGHHIVKSHI